MSLGMRFRTEQDLPLILNDLAEAVEHAIVVLSTSSSSSSLKLTVKIGLAACFCTRSFPDRVRLHSCLDHIQWVPVGCTTSVSLALSHFASFSIPNCSGSILIPRVKKWKRTSSESVRAGRRISHHGLCARGPQHHQSSRRPFSGSERLTSDTPATAPAANW